MSSPMRFDKGVSNVASGSTMAQLGGNDPSKYQTFFEDFNTYSATDWVITTTEAGAGSATEAITPGHGGLLLLTNAAGDNDLDSLQYSSDGGTTPAETFLFATGKKGWFKTKFQVNDATESDVVIGLHITDTDPVGGVSDGVYFRKMDGVTAVYLVVEKDSVESTVNVGALANATDISLGWYWDGVSTFTYFVNDVEIGTLTPGTSLPDDEELAVSFTIQNGAAAAKTMTIDYILAVMER